MAKLTVNYYSSSLKRDVELTVLLPVDRSDKSGVYLDERPYRGLYLLHGMMGNRHDWIDKTLLMSVIQDTNIAVIMPSGENAMYIDNRLTNIKYGEWIGKELPEITRKMFPLSHKKEDTFLAGLSMGGFGALMNGFNYSDVFSVIGSFSAPIMASKDLSKHFGHENLFSISFASQFLDNPDAFDIYKALEKAKEDIPKLYLSCGSDDFLIRENRQFIDYLKAHNIPHDYFEEKDGHTWTFWDLSIRRFISYLQAQ